MPRVGRDDLRIDANPSLGARRNPKMPPIEHQDSAAVLDEFVNRTGNLPQEITFMQEEIQAKDQQMDVCLRIAQKNDDALQKWIRLNGSHLQNPKEQQLRKVITENMDKADILQAEKITLSQKTQRLLDKHTRWLDIQIQGLQDRGEFPNDPDLPSLLRPQAHDRSGRVDLSAASMPTAPINPSAPVHTRHPNQHPPRVAPPQVHNHPHAASASSAPATPAASLLMNRAARESSLGAASTKRQRLTGGLGTLPANPSNLGRHSSMTPNTPRAGTPGAGPRAGSAGPRAAQKTVSGTKKVAPTGSRQSGMLRKAKPGKSGLGRLKRTKASEDNSEASDQESGSVDEDSEAVTPPTKDGDEDMVDIDDEGGDDTKYCTCQSVSYGDMVACDNPSCPYEWFHWSCVGLKSEPAGSWICPPCTKAGFRK